MNKIFLTGNLTRNPEMRATKDGIQVTSFTIAVNKRGKDGEAEFFKINAWRGLAENCQKYLSKGKKAAVVGSVSLNTYTGNDGKQRASLEVNADEVEFLSPRDERKQETADERSGFVEVTDSSESLPF